MNVYIGGGCEAGKKNRAESVAHNMARESRKPIYYITSDNDRNVLLYQDRIEKNPCLVLKEDIPIMELLMDENIDAEATFVFENMSRLLLQMANGNRTEEEIDSEISQFLSVVGNTVVVSGSIARMKLDRRIASGCDMIMDVWSYRKS